AITRSMVEILWPAGAPIGLWTSRAQRRTRIGQSGVQDRADGNGQADYDRLRVQYYFVFKNEADIVRLLDGLSKAGMPELPPGIDPKSTDRLTAAEMQSLVFGHELRGRRTAPEVAEYRRITAIDGSTTVMIGSQTFQGTSWTQAGALCGAYPKILTGCGVIFRDP